MRQARRFYWLILGIFLFLVINLQNNSLLNQLDFEENIAEDESFTYTSHAASSDEEYAEALDELDLHLYPGTSFNRQSSTDESSLNHCKALVYKTLQSLPERHAEQLQHLTLYFAEGRRGLGGGSTIILRCSDVSDKELMSVLVHEMGHLVDTGLYTGNSWKGESEFTDMGTPVYKNDVSLRFYRLSWINENTMKEDAKNEDFVSGYAKTDPFEDFAETYNYYLLHGTQFKEMAKSNKQLLRKYLFMKYFIFAGKEYDIDPYTIAEDDERVYDSTLVNYDQEKLIALSGF